MQRKKKKTTNNLKILAKNSLREKKTRKFDRQTLPPAYPKISTDFSRNLKLQA